MNFLKRTKPKNFLNIYKFKNMFQLLYVIKGRLKKSKVKNIAYTYRARSRCIRRGLYVFFRSIFFFYTRYCSIFRLTLGKFFISRKKTGRAYLRIDFNREHPYYLLLGYQYAVHKVFSTGFLLKLYNMPFKFMRRSPDKYLVILSFLRRFLKKTCTRLQTTAVILGYRYKYSFYISNLLVSFINLYCNGLFIAPQTKMLRYDFRRVKAIKKRIKKRILKKSKLYLKIK